MIARVGALFLACALLALGVIHIQTVGQLDRATKELRVAWNSPQPGLTTTWPLPSITISCAGAPCTIATGTTAASGYDFWIGCPATTSMPWLPCDPFRQICRIPEYLDSIIQP